MSLAPLAMRTVEEGLSSIRKSQHHPLFESSRNFIIVLAPDSNSYEHEPRLFLLWYLLWAISLKEPGCHRSRYRLLTSHTLLLLWILRGSGRVIVSYLMGCVQFKTLLGFGSVSSWLCSQPLCITKRDITVGFISKWDEGQLLLVHTC